MVDKYSHFIADLCAIESVPICPAVDEDDDWEPAEESYRTGDAGEKEVEGVEHFYFVAFSSGKIYKINTWYHDVSKKKKVKIHTSAPLAASLKKFK